LTRGAALAVLMDASALLAPFQLGLDFERWTTLLCDPPVKFYVLEDTLMELRSISESTGKAATAAKEAFKLAQRYDVLPYSGRKGDDGLIEAALRFGLALATCDSALRGRSRDLNIPVLSPTGRRKVRIEGLLP
jgi:rRNA-processing protein FCF1